MAADHTQNDANIPYLDELYPPSGDEAPSITAGDIAHTVERLEAGWANGEYTGMRESDLAVLWHVGQLGRERLHAVMRDPSLLPRLLTPTVHA